MKKVIGKVSALLLMLLSVMLAWDSSAYAKSQDMTIPDGVYMEDMNLSGMTQEEAMQMVNDFVAGLKQKVVTFGAVGDHYVAVTAGDLGMTWVNTAAIEEAAGLGKAGNIVQRYKAIQDLKHGNKVYKLELGFDKDLIRNILQEQCAEYDVQAENAQLTRQDGSFQVVEGQTGEAVNVEESLNQIYEYLTNGWDYQDASIDLVIDTTQPKGNAEDLAKVKDVLGTYTTSYSTSGSARCKNVENGCRLINGTTLYPGEEFSTLDKISPFTEANGYYPAGSYLNGMVVDSLGGGICQVSTTLYNAVLLSELEVTQRSNHSMIISYVKPSMDAAIAESSGKDFKFVNNLDYPIYIEGYTGGKQITFVIYGVETRDPGHKVKYESEVLSTTEPDSEKIIADSSQGIGFVSVQSAHIGYKAQLWKIVEENGVEVSREVINTSSYKMTPRTATVGVKTDNAVYASRIQAAGTAGSTTEYYNDTLIEKAGVKHMDFGKLPEHIYQRSVEKVIHTTEYRKITINGAGLGADCAILPDENGYLVTAQGSADGADVKVAMRAIYAGLNKLAATGVFPEQSSVCASLNVAAPHSLTDEERNKSEMHLRECIRWASEAALTNKVTIISAEVNIVPAMHTYYATASFTARAGQNAFAFMQSEKADKDVVMTKWMGLEGTSLIASARMQELAARYPLGLVEQAADFDRFLSVIPEAATAVQSGVSAMQAVREGGVFGGLWQLAKANGVGLVIDLKQIPVKQETIEVCEFYDVNPYELLSGGSMLMITQGGTRLVSLLAEQGISAAVIGRTTDNNDRILVNDEEKRFLEPARHDSLYRVLATS